MVNLVVWDIKWIRAELDTLKDQLLIDMLKRLIQYAKEQNGAVEEVPTIPDWHYEEIERRMQAHLSGDGKTYTWEESKARIKEAIKNR